MDPKEYNKKKEIFEAKGQTIPHKPKTCDVVQLPAMGRPFRLGMLYDRRKDMVIPGETLWSTEVLMKHTTLDNQEGCDFFISTEDSMEEKTSSFDVDGKMKLNWMSGMVSVGSSGKFLKDKKSSANKVRVSLICDCFTHYRQFTLPSKADFPETLENTDATHIVVGIKYGAKVIFVFERTVEETEDKMTIKGELQGKIERIPTVSIEGSAEIQYKTTEKKRDDQISCKFFGDLILPVNPTTYDEAINLYKNLPSHINKDKSAPVIVWLYPLSKLKHRDSEITHISSLNVERLEYIFDNLEDINATCSDILQKSASRFIPEMKNEITKFARHLKLYQQMFKDKLATALTNDMDMTERPLKEVLADHDMSPFAGCHLTEWMKMKLSETKLLSLFIDEMLQADIQFVGTDLDQTIQKYTHDEVITLRVMLPLRCESLLKTIDSYVGRLYPMVTSSGTVERRTTDKKSEDAINIKKENQIWYNDDQILQRLRKCIKHFVQFSTMNTDDDIVCTAMILFQDNVDSSKCTKFEYYSEMELKKESYEIMTSDEISSFMEE